MCDYSTDDLKQLLNVYSEAEYLSLSIQKSLQMHNEITTLMNTVINKKLLFFLSLFNKVLLKEKAEYDGILKSCTETFEFPKVSIRDAMRFWYLGQTVSNDGPQVVKPFRTIQLLPKRLQNVFKIQWKRIFSYLENGINLSKSDATSFTLDKTTEIYEQFVLYLKRIVSIVLKERKAIQ